MCGARTRPTEAGYSRRRKRRGRRVFEVGPLATGGFGGRRGTWGARNETGWGVRTEGSVQQVLAQIGRFCRAAGGTGAARWEANKNEAKGVDRLFFLPMYRL